MKTQTFNVVCVTKRNNQRVSFHEEGTGLATTLVKWNERNGLNFPELWIKFGEWEYPVLSVRTGLDGTATTIAIEKRDESPYKIWELYTDHSPHGVPASEIRSIAQKAISHARTRRG